MHSNKDGTYSFHYTLNNLKLSDAGEYTCVYYRTTSNSFITIEPFHNTSATVTALTVQSKLSLYLTLFIYIVVNNIIPSIITVPNKTVYDAGNNVILSCSITYPTSPLNDVNTNVNIEWKYRNVTVLSYTAVNNYSQFTLHHHISNMKLSDAGEYTCYSFVSTEQYHPYILDSNLTFQSIQLPIQGIYNQTYLFMSLFIYTVANNVIPSIVTVPSKTVYDVGNNVTLSCFVTYPTSPPNDVNTSIDIEWKYRNITVLSYTAVNNYSQFTLHYHISNMKLSDAGEYTCYSSVSTEQYHPYISNSSLTSQSIQLLIKGI